MASRTTVVRLAVEGIQSNITALERMGTEGNKALGRLGVGAAAANQNVDKLDKSMGNFSRWGRSNVLQQAGYQIGDFAVQVQSGTNVVVAATQQLSQFAGAFGIVGAAVGAGAAILGGVITYFDRAGSGAGSAADQLKKLDEGTESYKETLAALEPLQRQYLENLNQAATAQQRINAAYNEANSLPARQAALQPALGAGVDVSPELAQQVQQEDAAFKAASSRAKIEQATSILHNERMAEYIATEKYLLNRAQAAFDKRGGGVSAGKLGFEAAGGGVRAAERGSMEELGKYDQAQVLKAQQDREADDRRATAARDASAKATETLAIANEKLLETAKLNTEAAQAETEALTMGEDARKRANVEREYEKSLLEAAQPAHKAVQLALIDEANARRDASLAAIEQARALEDVQDQIDRGGQTGSMGQFYDTKFAGKSTPNPAVDKQIEDTKEFTRIQEEILLEPWKNLATGVSQITTNMFDEMLEKGQVSLTSLADGVEDLFRTTIAGTLGNVVAMPINMAVAEIAKNASAPGGSLTGAFSQFGSEHPYMAAAGLGAAGGYATGTAYGALTGKQDTYAATGGAVGGAAGAVAGAAIGSAFPVIGTVAGGVAGGALGSIAGSFIGGFFGGEGLGNDQSVQKFGSKVAKAIWSDQSFSEENRQVTSGIIGQLSQLGEALKGTGANVRDFQLAISAGNKTGIQVGGKGYGTDADAAAAAAIQIMLQNTGGLQGSQQTALRKTQGRNVQEVMEDLAFAKEFDKITFAGTQSEAAMRDLTEQFDALGRRARALGLDEMALAATRERAMAQLTLAAQRQARDLGAQFQMAIATTDLQRGIIGVNQQFAGLNDALTDAGYSAENLAQLEGARVAAEGQVRAQAAAQAEAEAQARAQQAAAAAQQRQAEADARRQEAEQRRQQAIQDAEARKQAARQARSLLAQYAQTITQSDLERTIIGINEQFAQLRDTMKDAGYNAAGFAQVEKARGRAIKEAQEQDRRSRRDLLAQYLDATGTSELERTLRGIDLEFVHLTETLKEAGYNSAGLAEVEKARVRAQADAIKEAQRQTQDLQRDMESRILGIGSFYDQLIAPLEAINQNNMLNPAGQIGAARQAFQADLGGAGARDPEAIRRLAGSAQQYQQLLQQNYGTGGLGGQGLREIQGGISGTIAGLQQERAAALADLPQIVQKTTLDIIRENRADIDRVVEQLELLRRDLRGRGIAA